MAQPEKQLQKSCVTWFKLQYPQIADLLFAIPNSNDMSGSNRKLAMIMMAKLKSTGLTPGMPDLMLAIPRVTHVSELRGASENHNAYDITTHGLFIEMKIKPNKPSDKQIHIHDQLRDQGFRVEVIYTFDAFMDLINEYLRNNGKYS